jgi:SAM-dependent methyltransferase
MPAPSHEAPRGRERPDAARFGNPSLVWRSGQERRLNLIERYVPLEERRALDLGCGVGEYVRAFARRGATAFGADIAVSRLSEARRRDLANPERGVAAGLMAAAGETLPFSDGSMDVIVLNEVIEHVADDRATLAEVGRVLAPGGMCVIFAPNRLFPFETHGIYIGRRYLFGNVPFVNWLPGLIRDRLVPHARVYRHGDWRRLVDGLPFRIVDHTYVYPGFDNIEVRFGILGRAIRRVCYRFETTPLRRFGLSHLVVLRRDEESQR